MWRLAPGSTFNEMYLFNRKCFRTGGTYVRIDIRSCLSARRLGRITSETWAHGPHGPISYLFPVHNLLGLIQKPVSEPSSFRNNSAAFVVVEVHVVYTFIEGRARLQYLAFQHQARTCQHMLIYFSYLETIGAPCSVHRFCIHGHGFGIATR